MLIKVDQINDEFEQEIRNISKFIKISHRSLIIREFKIKSLNKDNTPILIQ